MRWLTKPSRRGKRSCRGEPRHPTFRHRTTPISAKSYNINSFSGTILGDIGLPRPEVQQAPEDSRTAISLEDIGTIDGTALFVTLWGEEDSLEGLETLVANPLWQSLEVVQTERVYRVPDEYWMTGIGYLAAERVLDDIIAYLVDGADPAPLPE